jgi:hypothetical protein
MTEREGEGRKDEVSEDPEEALEHYREEIKEKYDDDEEKKDESNGHDKGEPEEPRERDNSDGDGSAETASGTESESEASKGQTEGTRQTDSQDKQEVRPENSGENADREDANLEKGGSPDRTAGEDGLESMREHLNEKYPSEEKDAAEGDGTQPAIPSDSEDEGGVDPPEANHTESGKQQTAEAHEVSPTDQTETLTNNAAKRPEHDLTAQEDVGWEAPEGHATPDKPQDPSRSDEIQPNEVGSPHAVVENGDSKQPQNESKEEGARPAETPPSDETQAGKVEPAKTDANDLSSVGKPQAGSGQTGGENPDNQEQRPSEKPVADKENEKTTDLYSSPQQVLGNADRESGSESAFGSDRPSGQRIKENPVTDASEGDGQTGTRLGQLESQNHDAKTEQASLVDAVAYYMSNSGKIRLDVDKAALEEVVGQGFRDGDMYRIAGHVEGTSSHFEARLSGTKGDYAYVFLDGNAEGVVPGQGYKLRIEQVEKDRTFEVSEGSRGPSIRVYETVLESLGVTRDGSDSVVQFQVRNAREGEVRQVYANYNSATGWMQISVGEIGARPADRLEITGGRRYMLEDAVADFNRQKPESLKNVSMTLEKGKLFLGIDGQRFEAKEPRLTSHGGKAVLKMGIAEDNVKFQFDGKTVTSRFENSERIREFRTIGDGLYATREPSKDKSHLHRLVPEKVSSMSYEEMREWSSDKIRIISAGNEIKGGHQLETTEEFQAAVRRRLTYAGTRRKAEKGDVGEMLASKLFESIGLETVEDHPFSTDIESRGSSRRGPESVVRLSTTGRIYYTEVKNHTDEERAKRKAISQVKWYCDSRPMYGDERISGAFIATTNWEGRTSVVNFHVDELSLE